MLNHFTLPQIPKYDGRGDPAKYLNSIKTHMGAKLSTYPLVEQPRFGTLEWRSEEYEVGLTSRRLFLSASLRARKVKSRFNNCKI